MGIWDIPEDRSTATATTKRRATQASVKALDYCRRHLLANAPLHGLGPYPSATIGPSLKKVSSELLLVGGADVWFRDRRLGPIGVRSRLHDGLWCDRREANRPHNETANARAEKESKSHSADRHGRLHPRRCDLARSLGPGGTAKVKGPTLGKQIFFLLPSEQQ